MKVYVSPTYHGSGWFDPKAAMNFFKRDGIVTIPDGTDLTNINRYIKLNYLIKVEEEPVEEIPQVVISTANELLSKNVEVVEEMPIGAPVDAAAPTGVSLISPEGCARHSNFVPT